MGPNYEDPDGKVYCPRFYMLFALGMYAEAAGTTAEKEKMLETMLRQVHATSAKMRREDWIGHS